MELASMYIGIHKKVHPWLKDYLNGGRIPLYQQKLLGKIKKGERFTFNHGRILGRMSGKTGAQLAYLEAMLGPQEPVTRPFRISDELSQDWQHRDVFSEALSEISRRAARAMEERVFNQLMYGTPEHQQVVLQNGSRITPVPSSDNIRGQRYLHPGVIATMSDESTVPAPTRIRNADDFIRMFGEPNREFRMEYLADFGAGDRDGDVPSVHDDSSQQA